MILRIEMNVKKILFHALLGYTRRITHDDVYLAAAPGDSTMSFLRYTTDVWLRFGSCRMVALFLSVIALT
jgi:hypothetical protein